MSKFWSLGQIEGAGRVERRRQGCRTGPATSSGWGKGETTNRCCSVRVNVGCVWYRYSRVVVLTWHIRRYLDPSGFSSSMQGVSVNFLRNSRLLTVTGFDPSILTTYWSKSLTFLFIASRHVDQSDGFVNLGSPLMK